MDRRKTGTSNLDGSGREGALSSFSTMRLSSSSFSSRIQSQSQGQVQAETEAETESGQGQGQGSKVKEAPVNDLPPEMLMEVLEFVDTCTLFNCRLVNRQWSAVATEILTTRSDAKITFELEKDKVSQESGNKKVSQEIENQKSRLKRFLHCMKQSENCPFAHFTFLFKGQDCDWDLDYADCFKHEDFHAFLVAVQNQKIQIKALELKCHEYHSSCKPLIELLRDLLLNKIPHLEELGLDLIDGYEARNKEMKLFPETVGNPVSVVPVQLPHLKTIRLGTHITAARPQFLKDLLNSAVNLNKIYLYPSNRRFSFKLYDFFDQLEKAPLLRAVQLCGNFLSKVKKRPEFTRALLDLELEELELDPTVYVNDEAVLADARNFISSLLESNKTSLKKLRLRSLRYVSDIQFPSFQNLTELKVISHEDDDIVFPSGVRSLEIFPAVRKLDLLGWSWAHAFSHLDSIPVFPRLQKLSVSDVGFTGDSIQSLPLLCQNLKHLKIHRQRHDLSDRSPTINFLDVGRQIWTHLNMLESLEIDVDLDLPENSPSALDSCFTGISMKKCERLAKMKKLQKTLKIFRLPFKISKSRLAAEREHPSILDMTNLKRLKINLYSGEKFLDGNAFFSEKLTWVSEEYAFKFLPHLKPTE